MISTVLLCVRSSNGCNPLTLSVAVRTPSFVTFVSAAVDVRSSSFLEKFGFSPIRQWGASLLRGRRLRLPLRLSRSRNVRIMAPFKAVHPGRTSSMLTTMNFRR